jgi:hypothetical protein
VAGLDRDQRLQRAAQVRWRDGVQRSVKREIEDLVEDEAAPEAGIGSEHRHRGGA